jgi:hypothetical protein
MPGLVLIILLAVAVVAVLAAILYLGWRIYRLGRNAFAVGGHIQSGIDRLAPGLAELDRKSAALADEQARLAASLVSLQESMARLEAVSRLFGEATAPLSAAVSRGYDIYAVQSVFAAAARRARALFRR